MARSVKALANPALIQWARKTAGYDLAMAAQKLGQDEKRLGAWEAGEEQPTIAQLRKAAEVYKRPLAVFYLDERPTGFTALKDFRRLPQGMPRSFSPKLRFLIRRFLERQEWAEEYRKQRGGRVPECVGSETITSNASDAATRVRRLLKISLAEQQSWGDPNVAFRRWIEACEAVGVLVFQSSDVALDEMRGFAVPRELAPAVLVNSKDTRAARIFTLFHELAHILIGAAGVSDLRIASQPRSEEQGIEVFCNSLAAETLVPESKLVADVKRNRQSGIDGMIKSIARLYSVSREVIARRLLDLNRITKADYEQRRTQYAHEAEIGRSRQRKNGPLKIPRSTIIVRNNGRQFTREVLAAYGDGDVTARDLAGLLDTRLRHIPRVESEVFSSRWQGATVE